MGLGSDCVLLAVLFFAGRPSVCMDADNRLLLEGKVEESDEFG